ncbi:M14 family metallopeptidase [Nafulsella turpanensis]|uniref:M14 family metallopeptidase n=1 Tax=Nafulsella turpanensis TaxID=1265690 RepID=UPI001F273C62|nr:M14 family metallopeptidase [Nafulsella turpanensis]
MMTFIKKATPLLAMGLVALNVQAQEFPTRFEQSGGTETFTYQQGIDWWQKFDQAHEEVKMLEMGPTDSGKPLHLVLWNTDENFDLESLRKDDKTVVLVNNAIHPGEPDGTDASMLLMRDLLQNKKLKKRFENVVVAIIPFYNIGGTLNRNSFSRANQEGPEAYGFRGNAQNLDLNRDFIKNDSKNARSFTEIFHSLDPDLYVETHVSNGADYQYTMTLLPTQHNKLGGVMGPYLENQLEPALYKRMEKKDWPMVPYVNVFGTVPDSGMVQFMDSPRYSSGFAALHNTFGFITETHMLKPYKQRVAATRAFLESVLEEAAANGEKWQELKEKQAQQIKEQENFVLNWKVDKSRPEQLLFKGYEASLIPSKVSGQDRLYYDRSKPFEKNIPFYNQYVAAKEVEAPAYYAIPQGWWQAIELLKANGVEMQSLENDTSLQAEVYYIGEFETVESPYEGHYLHYNIETEKKQEEVQLLKGDYLIPVNQEENRYIVETLEPEAKDSYFAWNFFDAILQQKEHFSPYVFEEVAEQILKEDEALRKAFEEKKASDAEFAGNGYAQLNYIYEHSPYYEEAHRRYPVFRITEE